MDGNSGHSELGRLKKSRKEKQKKKKKKKRNNGGSDNGSLAKVAWAWKHLHLKRPPIVQAEVPTGVVKQRLVLSFRFLPLV